MRNLVDSHGFFCEYMAKNNKLKSIDEGVKALLKLEIEVEENREASEKYMNDLWVDADDKEQLFYGSLSDEISKNTAKSSVFDPRLQTIVFERAARVTARDHIGYSKPVSEDDHGACTLLDLKLDHYYRNANSQYSMPVKLRNAAIGAGIYGSQFALVPWRIDSRRGYIGADLELIPFRNGYPQPGVTLNDAEWFGVRSVVTLQWLKNQDKNVWKGLDELVKEYEGDGGDKIGDNDTSKTSWMEREFHPTRTGTKKFPMVELYTEYRMDKWVTLALCNPRVKNSRTRVVRVVESPLDGLLPIVERVSLPVPGRAVGYGEVERLASLQKAINSAVNLNLDWVKFAIFPPTQINAENVVKSSIVMTPGARWFVKNPNVDIQQTTVNQIPQQVFANTYGYILGAMNTAAGTTSTNDGTTVTSTLGKTPAAIEYQNQRQNARDLWDQKMHENFIREIYLRWQQYEVNLSDKETTIRLYGKELEEMAKKYPKITYRFENESTGKIKISPDVFKLKGQPIKYDYDIEMGSTLDQDPGRNSETMQQLLELVVKNPQYVQEMEQHWGKTINKAELLERAFSSAGIKDWDDIVVDASQVQPAMPQPGMQPSGMEQSMMQSPGMVAMGGAPQVQPNQAYQYQDPEVAQIAQQIFGQ